MFKRPRRNRSLESLRMLIQENHLHASDLVAPLFLIEGTNKKSAIKKMPGIYRKSLDCLLEEAEELHRMGVQGIALFPVIETSLKNEMATESYNENGLIPIAIKAIKKEIPSLCLFTDVALDPYTSHGHDGIVNSQKQVDNDKTLEVLIKQALTHAKAGVDFIAPSDMMDGRVKVLRKALDQEGFTNTGILSYSAKYTSALYATYRDAIRTSLAFGDKKSYQLNPANSREAILESIIDEEEGADMLMIKPALFYLDIISKVRAKTNLPIAAFHVSGEYAMVMAAHEKGYLDADQVFYEALLSIKRAGADFIFTYAIRNVLSKIECAL